MLSFEWGKLYADSEPQSKIHKPRVGGTMQETAFCRFDKKCGKATVRKPATHLIHNGFGLYYSKDA